MAFIKRATIIGTFYTGNQIESLKSDWINIVKSGQTLPPFEEFDWEPDKFLYYRARAITANVPNQNGDFFPDTEIEKSYHTFRGKGVYYNHDSDSPDKAFGIILDAIYFKDSDDKYVQILAAIDKEEIEKKRPGLLKRIVEGKLRTTSMSCLVNECICSVCGNVATDPSSLCIHMDPKSPHYIKGRVINGSRVYEINKGITFIEDSIVEVPADPTAYVFQIYSSCNVDNIEVTSERLKEHFKKYSSLKQSNFVKDSVSLDELVDQVIEKKFENKIKQLIDEQVRKKIDPLLVEIEQKILPKVEPVVEKKIEEKSTQIEKIPNEPEEKKPEEKPETERVEKQGSTIDQLMKEPKIILEEIPEKIDLSPYSFKLYRDTYLVKKDGKTIGSISIPKDFGKLPRKEQQKYLLEKAENLMKSEKSTPESKKEAKKMGLTAKYVKGKTFDDSYFVFDDGKDTVKVKASEIIPLDVQKRILENDENIVSPEEISNQIVKFSEGSMEKLTNEVLPSLVKSASKRNESFVKKAEWSWSEEEVPTKLPKPGEVTISVNKEEIPKAKSEPGTPVKIKQFFGRLPSKGVGEPTQSINIQSSVDQDEIIKAKIEMLKKAIEEEKEKREKAEKELAALKEEKEKKDKSEVIEEIIGKMKGISELGDEQVEKITSLLNKFALPQLNILGQIIDVLAVKPEEEKAEEIAGISLEKPEVPVKETTEIPVVEKRSLKKEASIPQIFISNENPELDIIEIAQRSLEK